MDQVEIIAKLRKKLKKNNPVPFFHIEDVWFPDEEPSDVYRALQTLGKAGEARIDYGFGWSKA